MLNSKSQLNAVCLALVSMMGATGANAIDFSESGVYLGIDAGQAEARKFCKNVVNCDSSDTTVRGHVGYQFNKVLGAELGYTSFGTLFDANNDEMNASQEVSAWTLSALGTWPIVEQVGIFGRLGISRYNTDSSGTVQGVPVDDEDSTETYFGAGVKFSLGDHWALRGEYQRYMDISGADDRNDSVQAVYAGGMYIF